PSAAGAIAAATNAIARARRIGVSLAVAASLPRVRRIAFALLTLALVATLAACGGGSKAGPASELLHPEKLTAKAPQLFDVTFKTTKGDFTITVHRTWAPIGAARVYNLAKAHFFDGVKFFRVVPNFVVQFGISPYPAVSKIGRAHV